MVLKVHRDMDLLKRCIFILFPLGYANLELIKYVFFMYG